MIRRPPISTRTYTLWPYTTRILSLLGLRKLRLLRNTIQVLPINSSMTSIIPQRIVMHSSICFTCGKGLSHATELYDPKHQRYYCGDHLPYDGFRADNKKFKFGEGYSICSIHDRYEEIISGYQDGRFVNLCRFYRSEERRVG